MSEQDRGAYAPPSEEPLAFDPRHDGERRGPAPLALIVSALVLIALIAGLMTFYRHGARKPGQAPQVVGAPIGDTKSPPLSSEGPTDATAGLQVYKTETPPPSETAQPPAPTFAPAPEQPQPRPVSRPPQPAPVSITPLRPAQPSASPPAPPRKVAAAEPAPPPAPTATVAAPPKPVRPAPVAAASSAKPAKPAKPAAAEPPATTTAAAGGGVLVQIGAFSSAALAQKGWSDTAHVLPGKMAGKSRKVEAASRDGKTFYRAYVGGFASHADAVSFCSALKAAGKACMVK